MKNKNKKDYSKYTFLGEHYRKGPLVLAVIKEHVKNHPDVTVDQLQSIFPKKDIHNAFEIVELVKDSTKGRFYLKLKDRIKNKEAIKMVVTNQWDRNNIKSFISLAKKELHVKIRQAA